MPRGRPRKQSAEVELLPPEETDQPKVMEVKHTEQWIEHRSVGATPDDDDIDFDEGDSSEGKRKRKTKNYREELRKKLRAHGVSPGTNLRVYIEKYLYSDSNTGGSWAETEFCTKYETTEEHLLNRDYIDVARRWGAGKYRITIRERNTILDAFDQRISAQPQTPTVQHVNPADPNSPQFIIQTTGDGQQVTAAPSMREIMKGQKEALKEHLEMTKLMREAYGFAPEQQQQPKSEEEVLAGAILKQPEVIENVVGNVIKRFGGASKGDDEPWYAEVVKDAVKSGQLAQVVKVAIESIFGGFKGLFPGGQNGQAPMAETPIQNQTHPIISNQQGFSHPQPEVSPQGAIDASLQVGQLQGGDGQNVATVGAVQPQTVTPAEQALAVVIANCAQKTPPQIVADQLLKHADLLNEQAPIYSIDGYLDMFAVMPVDDAIAFVKTQPNGEQVASLPHTKEWTEQLQKLIREAGQEGEE